ncbi:MAG: DUF3592 domain-containing protein [Candidatus Rifleibacteriota bacterium]
MSDRALVKYFFRAIFLMGGLSLLIGSVSYFMSLVSLMSFGIKTDAIVTKKEMVKSPRYANPEDQHDSYEIDYSFTVDGKKIKNKGKVISESNWEKISVDQKVEILYSRKNPEKNVPVMETGWTKFIKIFLGFALGLTFTVYGFIWEPKV